MLTWYLVAHMMYTAGYGPLSLTGTPAYQSGMENTRIETSNEEECLRLAKHNFGYECWATVVDKKKVK